MKQKSKQETVIVQHINIHTPFFLLSYFTTCETHSPPKNYPSTPLNLTYTCKNTHTVGLPDERTILSYQYNTCPTLLFAASLLCLIFNKLGSRPINNKTS